MALRPRNVMAPVGGRPGLEQQRLWRSFSVRLLSPTRRLKQHAVGVELVVVGGYWWQWTGQAAVEKGREREASG